MPIVNIQEAEKKAKKVKEESAEIETKVIGDKTYFRGKNSEDWYTNYDECLNENQKARQLAEYKSQGLNEYGQSKEQVLASKDKSKLLQLKAKLNDALRKIEGAIVQANRGTKVKMSDFELSALFKEDKRKRR